MLEKILKISFFLILLVIFMATIFYFATYPLIPKHFATNQLKEYFVLMEEDGEKFLNRELIDCSGFVTERDTWIEDINFLAKGELLRKSMTNFVKNGQRKKKNMKQNYLELAKQIKSIILQPHTY